MDDLDAFLDGKPAAPAASGADALDAFLDSAEPAAAPVATEPREPQAPSLLKQAFVPRFLWTPEEQAARTGSEKALIGLGGGIVKAGTGVIQAGAQVVGSDKTAQAAGDVTKQANRNLERLGPIAKGAGVVGEIAPYVALPASAPTLVGRIGLGAAGGAAQGALQAQEAPDLAERGKDAAIGALVGAAVPAGIAGVGKAIQGGKATAGAAKKALTSVDDVAARELASQGIEVSKATAGGDFVKNYMRNHLAGSTFGGKTVREAAGKVEGQIDAALDTLIRKTGRESGDPTSGGELVRGALDAAKAKFYDTAEQLYGRFESLVDTSAKADAKNVLGLVDDLKSEFAGTASAQAVRGIASETDDTIRNVVSAVNEDSKSGKLSLGLMLQLRKDIGSKLRDVPFSDARQGALKRLYGAISRDIEGTLSNNTMNVYWNKANMPQKEGVLAAWKDANRFYSRGLAEVKMMERKFGNTKSAEQIFSAVTGATKSDTANLSRMFSAMTPATRDSLKATVLRKLSVPSGGSDFTQGTVKTFVNNWNKLSPVSKKVLGADVAELDKLARNYDRVAPLISALPENGMRAGATIGDISAALATAGGILNPAGFLMGAVKFGGDAVLSRLITKPALLKTVNAAVQSGKPQVVQSAMQQIAKTLPAQGVREQFQALADEAEKISRVPVTKSGKGVRLNARPEATAAGIALAGGLGAANFGSSLATNTQYDAPATRSEQRAYERAATMTPDVAEPLPETPAPTPPEAPQPQPTSEESSPISQTLVDRIIGIESGGRADAKNPRSSATGAGQFINSTWMGMVERYRPELMIGRTKAEVLNLRKDPYVSRYMVQKYAEENASKLAGAGLPVSDTMVYLSHFLDGKNAVKLAKADPNTPAIRVIGAEAVRANPFLRGKRVSDVIAWAERKTRG